MLSSPACDMLKVQDSVHTNWSKAVGVVARKNLGLSAAYACEVGRLAATRLCPAGLEAMASPALAQAQLAQIWTALQATASKYSCALSFTLEAWRCSTLRGTCSSAASGLAGWLQRGGSVRSLHQLPPYLCQEHHCPS